ncbi:MULTISPECIES: glutamine-synthetase adenylyltransferase [unclassified Paracoccus (in: a-proteobacteria)]|uniref:[protein-PII] uridylyltransferase family protein n=1 Tax=unclassified Paracoccus (in: a-proteobacteria) TaxID=2688777 RepID=UPI0021E186B7|nr:MULTISPECIES: glutamine-synthetase adenylyltransferase [unclassified Paracoccus (in: a-proteobacteria)]UXU75137.1 glutamine-synthetase adenylyltransferase [Paracoccus sp. SMMA_5]UXU81039.1 glutamine-synthetase adenylyltransferase [Paracoccus sp. SMMA_5_TC]
MDFAARITRLPLAADPDRGLSAWQATGISDPRLGDLIRGAAGSSPYLAGLIQREADWLGEALSHQDHENVVARETAGFEALTADVLGPALRRAKRRVALWTALADLGGVWRLEQVTGALTDLADRATDLALRVHVAAELARGKLPPTAADAGGIVALAMGKMGAAELNYSSDIDLIVLYDDSAYAADDQHEARACLIRATRRAAATLSDNTDQGYVFRTDLRLRPDASVTPVCISFSAALAYYEAEGRTWERSAYIKARPCGGDLAAGERFLRELTPFVWRRHLDFAAIQDAHDMRLRIRRHKGLHGRIEVPGHDMKLGQGGIREIEFFTQTRQLIAGGRDPDLRARGTVEGLAQLARKGWVPPEVAEELTAHYREHREIEHRIQMVNDAQTHAVPATPEGVRTIALLSGQADADAWAERLAGRLARVEALTGDFFAPGEQRARPALSPEAEALVERWRSYPALRSQRGREVFSRIEPELLTRLTAAAHAGEALARFDTFLAGLPAGVQLFSLFEANPQLIDLIVDICATSPGLAAYLGQHPEVLDAVLGGSFFSPWPGSEELRRHLDHSIDTALAAPAGGYERALDAARRWAHEWQFRIGVHHLRALIGAEEAGGQYADIADSVVAALFPVVSAEFSRRHGPPPGRGAVVLGMGSLGARQLNAGSDLDLIVIYDAAGQETSEGTKPLATRSYYARLTQALITALSAPTAAGRLYEVDMRLRPSGRQGPVATSVQGFRDYQMTEAWTWEHLALTRARVVGLCGDHGVQLAAEVEALRVEILQARGGDPRVLPDLAEMRARIFAAKAPDGAWEGKIGRGRLQDIELLAQSLALRAGSAARGVAAQLRAGPRAGLIARPAAERLASARRFLWNLQCAARLLTDRPLDMESLGEGGQAFLLRETGAESLDDLAQRLAATVAEAGDLIDSALAGAGQNAAAL